jgi:hypothetical protein
VFVDRSEGVIGLEDVVAVETDHPSADVLVPSLP